MAESYAHQYGEIIGDFFEGSVIKYLRPAVEALGFYLDYRHERPARNGKKEVCWPDANGNTHKLDIVIEENGSEEAFGEPRAFIEIAWRRYSKHAKNKVQEISGAILPLVEAHKKAAPFYSAVLSGDFTKNAITQLCSQGFEVCHVGPDDMQQVFSAFGLTVNWREDTSEDQLEEMIKKYRQISKEDPEGLYEAFIRHNSAKLEKFKNALLSSLTRKLEKVVIMPMHGLEASYMTAHDACAFIAGYDEKQAAVPVLYYEIRVIFNTGEEYSCKCAEKAKAIEFLNHYV